MHNAKRIIPELQHLEVGYYFMDMGMLFGIKQRSDATPIKNLYLAGAWTQPGHGYGGVMGSGLQCFGEIMKCW